MITVNAPLALSMVDRSHRRHFMYVDDSNVLISKQGRTAWKTINKYSHQHAQQALVRNVIKRT